MCGQARIRRDAGLIRIGSRGLSRRDGGLLIAQSLRQGVLPNVAERMGVDVEVQNHAIFDDTPARRGALVARRPGEAHPFVMGTGCYVSFWNIVSECMQAEIIRRGDAA